MKAKILADGVLPVSYGFIHLDSGVGGWDSDVDQRAGQRNGLAGAAQPGFVLLTTGTHTGDVPLRIELYRKEPSLDERWDEVVEVSVDLRDRHLEVTSFEDELPVRKVRQSGPHRLRYSVLRFGDERERRHDQVGLDRYLVQLWPAPMAPDALIKQTSEHAAYWHELAREAKPNPGPDEQAATERAEDLAERQRLADDERAFERERWLWRWGGREPSPRLRALDPDATTLAVRRRDVVDAVEVLPEARQRALAVEVTGRVCRQDDDSPVDWGPALEALEEGRPLPAPFGDEDAVDRLMFGPAQEVTFEVHVGRKPLPRTPIHSGVSAAAAVRGAADPDPLAAALRAIEAASWSATDEDAFFDAVLALTH